MARYAGTAHRTGNITGVVAMAKERRRYIAYLLRLWRPDNDDRLAWRASLEDPHSGERKGFADLESMCLFLKEQLDAARKRHQPDE
jgi:hypothetical protein